MKCWRKLDCGRSHDGATVSDMEYYQIKIHSRIDDLNIDLVVSLESANEIHYELD